MAHRVQELGGEFVRVATFHSACARFLRKDGPLLGYPADFSIYDTQDRDPLIGELLEGRRHRAAQVKPHQIGQWISKLKNAALKPGDMGSGDDISRIVERLWTPCHERMKRSARWTSTTCSACSCRSCASTRGRRALPGAYPWLLVDEFQDTNRVQYDLLKRCCVRRRATSASSAIPTSRSTVSAAPRCATSLEVRPRLPDDDDRAARTELPQHGEHPARGRSGDRAQHHAQAEAYAHRRRTLARRSCG